MNTYIVIGIIALLAAAGGIVWYKKQAENGEEKDINWSFLKGASPDYCLIGHGNWEEHLEFLSDYNCNMIKVFLQCGWAGEKDGSGSNFKIYNGNNPNDINQGMLDIAMDFIDLANKKGIIVMLTLFTTNSGAFGEGMTAGLKSAEKFRKYIETVARAVSGKAVILDILNEEANQAFILSANAICKSANPGVRTNGYKVHGCDYISTHTADKRFTGGRNSIQSNDTSSAILGQNDDDIYNVTAGAKQAGGGVEWLLAWARDNTGYIGGSIDKIKKQWGGALGRIKKI